MEREPFQKPEDAVSYFLQTEPDTFTEGYIVEATVEMVVAARQFRLEVIRAIHLPSGNCDVRVYELKESQWSRFPIGYCSRETSADALAQAMGFLWDAFREKS